MNLRGRRAGAAGGGRGGRPLRRRVDRPAERHAFPVPAGGGPRLPAVSFDAVYAAYAEQVEALAEGGVDLLMVETIFDTLNAKAAIAAARAVAPQLPLWISVTIVDLSGRTCRGRRWRRSGASIEHAEPLVAGLNCSLGAAEMRPYVAELPGWPGCTSRAIRIPACRTRSAATTRNPCRDRAAARRVRRGRDGQRGRRVLRTTPAHIARIAAATAGLPPRPVPGPRRGRPGTAGWSRSSSAPIPGS